MNLYCLYPDWDGGLIKSAHCAGSDGYCCVCGEYLERQMKHKGKVKGSIVGVRVDSNMWYVKLAEKCALGNSGDVVVVSKAVKTPCGNLEVEE
jgi:hypothetical protein